MQNEIIVKRFQAQIQYAIKTVCTSLCWTFWNIWGHCEPIKTNLMEDVMGLSISQTTVIVCFVVNSKHCHHKNVIFVESCKSCVTSHQKLPSLIDFTFSLKPDWPCI